MSLLWFGITFPQIDWEVVVASVSSDMLRRRFLTIGQVAGLLGVSSMTIYRAVEAGELPAIRMRGRISIPAKAIDLMEEAAVVGKAVGNLVRQPHLPVGLCLLVTA